MFTATIFRLSVISLSGIMEATYVAKESVRQWNQANAERTGRMFLTVDDPQAADVLVGIVDNHLEKTELIADGLEAGRRVLLLFKASQDPKNTIASEQSAVADYMEQIRQRCYCAKFNSTSELNGLLNEQLNEIR